jgi:hypothetical protein
MVFSKILTFLTTKVRPSSDLCRMIGGEGGRKKVS